MPTLSLSEWAGSEPDRPPAIPVRPLFEVYGELSDDGTRVVLLALGDQQTAAAHLSQCVPTLSKTKPEGGLQSVLSWALVAQLASQLGKLWHPGPRLAAWTQAQAYNRFVQPELVSSVSHPEFKPFDHQVVGARLIAATGRSLLFDDAGTGKTLTTIMGLLELRARGRLGAGPILVICPNSVQDPWIEAVHDWTKLRAKAWRGSKDRRRRLAGHRDYDVYVASYGTAREDVGKSEPLTMLAPVAVVIDECHKIKNQDSAQSRAARRIAAGAQSVVALSGTPITHHVGDLFPTLQAVEPWAWTSRERYDRRYVEEVPGEYGMPKVLGLSPYREPEFRHVLHGQYRRLAKADVLDLPPKVYSVRTVELPATARKAYEQMEADMLAEIEGAQEQLSAMSVLAQMTRLLQLSCSSADVWTEEVWEFDKELGEKILVDKMMVKLREPSWKVDAFMEVLAERPGKQVVAFAPSRQLIELAATRCEKDGYRVARIVGGQSAKERTEEIRAFQAGERDVICVTTEAGGVGITLTAASTAVFLQRPWSYVVASQAEDRVHRIGSERHDSVDIIDIVAKKTIDARMREVLREKSAALADLVQDPRIVAECLGGIK